MVRTDPAYSDEKYITLSCIGCGKGWDLEVNGSGNGGILARWLLNRQTVAINGNA